MNNAMLAEIGCLLSIILEQFELKIYLIVDTINFRNMSNAILAEIG